MKMALQLMTKVAQKASQILNQINNEFDHRNFALQDFQNDDVELIRLLAATSMWKPSSAMSNPSTT